MKIKKLNLNKVTISQLTGKAMKVVIGGEIPVEETMCSDCPTQFTCMCLTDPGAHCVTTDVWPTGSNC